MTIRKREDRTLEVESSSVGGESSSTSDTFNSTPNWEYDVFLSFAGKDTRLNFTGHLYEAFIRSGIKCFRDDVDLPRGENINYLFQAIKDSLCAVLVISKNYAKSTWCLKELHKIIEARDRLNRRIFPIFYDVNPADVRHQRESFGVALAEHEEKSREDITTIQNWRTALSEIGNLSGWVTRNEHEADLIKTVVAKVWTYLSSKLPSYCDNLVGIHPRVGDMMPILESGLDDKRFVGIWGMGGLGKTTLARVVFKKLSHKFEICCFLANVRETSLERDGLVSLQKKLLSRLKIKDLDIPDYFEGKDMIRKLLGNKKILLVLDDIDDRDQLKNLADSPTWFGKGSRIIITTRYRQVLISSRVDEQRIYEMKTMEKDESLQLFSNKAFDKDHPEENYLKLSKYLVKYAGGLPLALEVLGSFLCGRSEDKWRDTLARLKQIPDKKILEVLEISYDGLNDQEKTIFLDIACFFKGWKRKKVTQVLESCDLNPTIGIDVLIQKTLLVETEWGILEVHDLLQDLGRHIVRKESPTNVGKRSRLWEFEDIKKVVENNEGSDAIEAIVMHHHKHQHKIEVHPEAFIKMSNIRLLMLCNDKDGSSLFLLPRELKYSGASKLKVVRWPSCPLRAPSLQLDELVYIQMNSSHIKKFWNGNSVMKRLKFINLESSQNLTTTPDFSGVPVLEHLHLSNCRSLVEVHHSLGKLKYLAEVYLDRCENLEILPRKLETNSLIKLYLQQCRKVTMLPEFGKGMEKLSYLDVSKTAITKLPKSLGYLIGLRDLKLSCCKVVNLAEVWKTSITSQIYGLKLTSLTELYLSECGLNDGSIPNDFSSLTSLIVLDLCGNDFVNLPTGCFSRLSRLLFLSLDLCQHLKSLPRLPPRLIRLTANKCKSLESLSDRQSWNLVASLVHEYRGQTKYVISCDDDDDDFPPWMPKDFDPNCLIPLRDFCAIIQGSKIPSWFFNQGDYRLDGDSEWAYEIKVNIPPHLCDSEWSGIVVCFNVWGCGMIRWSSKGAKDDDYIWTKWAHCMSPKSMCIMVLELNEETCWKHLTPHNNTLHIKLSGYFHPRGLPGGRWRLICKEEIQKWCNHNHFTQPQLPFPHHDDDINLPWRVLRRSFVDVVKTTCEQILV